MANKAYSDNEKVLHYTGSNTVVDEEVADKCGDLPHYLTVTGSATIQIVSAFGHTFRLPITLEATGSKVFNGYKLKITVAAGYTVTVNGTAVSLTDGVGYYTVGTGADIAVVVEAEA